MTLRNFLSFTSGFGSGDPGEEQGSYARCVGGCVGVLGEERRVAALAAPLIEVRCVRVCRGGGSPTSRE